MRLAYLAGVNRARVRLPDHRRRPYLRQGRCLWRASIFAALDSRTSKSALPRSCLAVQWVLRPDEFMRLGQAERHFRSMVQPCAICFELAPSPLTAGTLLPIIIQKYTGLDNAKIEILDFSRFGVPRGGLEFPESSLMLNGLWRGCVLYGESRSMPVLAQGLHHQRSGLGRSSPNCWSPGKQIEASQLILENGSAIPLRYGPGRVDKSLRQDARPPCERSLPRHSRLLVVMLMIAHDV